MTKKLIELPPRGDWATAKQVAAYLGISASSVYQGQAGTGVIRCTRMGGGSEKPARRWYWPDVVAHSKRLLDAATQQQVQINGPLRFGRRTR